MSTPRAEALAAQEAFVRHALACANLDWFEWRDPEDQLLGLFQRFMPHGQGVAAVFDGLGDPAMAQALLQRLMLIYTSTADDTVHAFESGQVPWCFVPRGTDGAGAAQAELIALGEQQLAHWRTWAQDLGDADLVELLARITRVELVNASRHSAEVRARREAAPTHAAMDDALGNWWLDQLPVDHLMWVMHEAYYSIACDYWVSYHLQAPVLAALNVPHMPDLLAHNFALYLRGASLVLTEDTLLVTQDNLREDPVEPGWASKLSNSIRQWIRKNWRQHMDTP